MKHTQTYQLHCDCFFKPVVKRLTVHVINEGIPNCHKVFCGLNRFGLGLRLKRVNVIRYIGCLIGVSSTLYFVNLSRHSGIFSINCQTLRAYLLFPCASSDFPSCAKVIITIEITSSHLHYYTGSFLRICQTERGHTSCQLTLTGGVTLSVRVWLQTCVRSKVRPVFRSLSAILCET